MGYFRYRFTQYLPATFYPAKAIKFPMLPGPGQIVDKDDHDNIFDRLRELEQQDDVCPYHSDVEKSIVKLRVNNEKIKGEVKLLTVKTSSFVTVGVIIIAAIIDKLLNG